jgi:hypothetical protein
MNKDELKKLLNSIETQYALQSLIETIDENTDWSSAPICKFQLIEGLEDCYNSYMDSINKETINAS